ncbi:MAG: permease [Candidatus Thorarchaeota archaeon]
MVSIPEMIVGALESAIITLIDYLSFHVLLCLLPAFLIAGAMAAFIPQDAVMEYLGPESKPYVSYPAAATAGLLLAVCSCTVLPLFVGIYKKGAGLGPAMTFLFAAPAVNILALTYTGTLIGMDIALARAVLAVAFAVVIGLLMAGIFRNSPNNNQVRVTTPNNPEIKAQSNNPTIAINQNTSVGAQTGIVVASKQVVEIGLIGIILFLGILMALVELQPLLLLFYFAGIVCLTVLSYYSARHGVVLFSWLVFALLVGTSRIGPFSDEVKLGGIIFDTQVTNMVFKGLLVGLLAIGIMIHAKVFLDPDDVDQWMTETWLFVKQIFPLIIIGVFIAGMLKYFLPQDLVIELVGENTIAANLLAVFFGVFMYFPTLMEVPIAKLFLDKGMARGPLLAYLLADPELSIQSILVTRRFIGDKKNSAYVILVAIFTTLAGLVFGLIIGEGIGLL